MGTSSSAAEFSAKIHKFAGEVAKIPRDTAYSNAKLGKATMTAAVQSMAPGGRLRGVGKKGARVGAGYNVYGDGIVQISVRGPVWLVNDPTSAHDIAPKKRRGKGALYAPGYDHPYRGAVHVSGTSGKHRWDAARDGLLPPLLEKNIGRQMHQTALKAFG
jgi:hypothetical protein